MCRKLQLIHFIQTSKPLFSLEKKKFEVWSRNKKKGKKKEKGRIRFAKCLK